MMDPEEAREFGRVVIPSAIWILYMLKSRRVKLTFVRGKPETENAADGQDVIGEVEAGTAG